MYKFKNGSLYVDADSNDEFCVFLVINDKYHVVTTEDVKNFKYHDDIDFKSDCSDIYMEDHRGCKIINNTAYVWVGHTLVTFTDKGNTFEVEHMNYNISDIRYVENTILVVYGENDSELTHVENEYMNITLPTYHTKCKYNNEYPMHWYIYEDQDIIKCHVIRKLNMKNIRVDILSEGYVQYFEGSQ